jgi:hypothetical protein
LPMNNTRNKIKIEFRINNQLEREREHSTPVCFVSDEKLIIFNKKLFKLKIQNKHKMNI